jgi:hypothetical protein
MGLRCPSVRWALTQVGIPRSQMKPMPTLVIEPVTSPGRPGLPRTLLGCLLMGAVVSACHSSKGMPSPEALAKMAEGEAVTGPELQHRGPAVELGEGGPARFVRTLFNGFRERSAMSNVAKLDEHYRTPGSRGFEAALDLVEQQLREAGFGTRAGLELEVLTSQLAQPAWTALSGELRMSTASGGESVLHAFERPEEMDRCMLPANAPSATVQGSVCLVLAELKPGDIFVTRTGLRRSQWSRPALGCDSVQQRG